LQSWLQTGIVYCRRREGFWTERKFKSFSTESTETTSNFGVRNFRNAESTEKTGNDFSVSSAAPELGDGVEGEPLWPLR
jgi:hypothetical protein